MNMAELHNASFATTAVRDPGKTKFVYRDELWQGADLLGLGVASFSHLGGVHFQNLPDFESYTAAVAESKVGWVDTTEPVSK